MIEREKKSIIILVRADKSIWIFPKVATCWLIKNIVPNYVILSLEVFNNFQPHFNKFVIHPVFICKKIVRKANNVIRDVVFEEWHLQAVLFKRITILISSEIYFEGGRKAKWSDQPIWKPLATESFTVEIMMGVDDYWYPKDLSLSYYFLQNW